MIKMKKFYLPKYKMLSCKKKQLNYNNYQKNIFKKLKIYMKNKIKIHPKTKY